MCVPIQRVRRNSAGVLTHIGGSTAEGVPWGLSVAEAIALDESTLYSFFVEIPAGQRVDVLVKRSTTGTKYLTTSPDGVLPNNLEALPDLPNPLEGVEPWFPLSLPGPKTARLTTITSIDYSGNHALTSLAMAYPLPADGQVHGIIMPTAFWRQTPRLFYVDAVVPFPAQYWIFLNDGILEHVASDNPARRWTLEAAGQGWWSSDLVLTHGDGTIDPTMPSRLNAIKIVIRPGSAAWSGKNIKFFLAVFSMNPYCLFPGAEVGVRIREATAPPPPPPPATKIMPSLVAVHLDTALKTLGALGLTRIHVVGPVALASDQQVDAQTPAAGTTVKLTDEIWLRTSLAVAQSGIKKIVISNQSNRAVSLDLWLFAYSSGTWAKDSSLAYQDETEVLLGDGDTYAIAAVDPTLLNCHTSRPDEASCVYAAPQGAFLGNSSGAVVPWQIT